ncbi:MAG: hypothetical protein QW734_07665 [Candidatus Bathyarchaeia archaeon]
MTQLGVRLHLDLSNSQKGLITVKGRTSPLPNLLVHNWYRILIAMLTVNNDLMINTGGSAYNARVTGALPYGAPQIWDGLGTVPEALSDYTITSAAALVTTVSFGVLADRMRIAFGANASKDGTELGLTLTCYDTAGNAQRFLAGRKVVSFLKGDPISWNVDLYQPWVYNWLSILRGLILNENRPDLLDMAGTVYTLRISGAQAVAGPVYLCVGTGTGDFSFYDYTLTDPAKLTTTSTRGVTGLHALLFLSGSIVPTADIVMGELGIVQPLYDTGGVTHDTLLARFRISPTITLPANKRSIITVRWLAY